MIEVEELNDKQCEELLSTSNYGHLACCINNEPYVVPIHYAYQDGYIYIYTTEGKKYEIIKANPRVCLQVESVNDIRDWRSVIAYGEARPVADEEERRLALSLILETNPALTPAVSIRWMDSWVRENIEVIYKVIPVLLTGRASVPGSETRRAFVPDKKSSSLH